MVLGLKHDRIAARQIRPTPPILARQWSLARQYPSTTN